MPMNPGPMIKAKRQTVLFRMAARSVHSVSPPAPVSRASSGCEASPSGLRPFSFGVLIMPNQITGSAKIGSPIANTRRATRQSKVSMSQVNRGIKSAPDNVTPNWEIPMAEPRLRENQLAINAELGTGPASANPTDTSSINAM